MKYVLYFFGICIFIGLVLAFVVSTLPVFPYAGKAFLMSVESGYYERAYNMLSADFRQKYELKTFKELVQKSGIDQYQSVAWEKEVINQEKTHGYVKGVITTKKNRKIPIQFYFVRLDPNGSDEAWYIENIRLIE